jgi:hypothetical protein
MEHGTLPQPSVKSPSAEKMGVSLNSGRFSGTGVFSPKLSHDAKDSTQGSQPAGFSGLFKAPQSK